MINIWIIISTICFAFILVSIILFGICCTSYVWARWYVSDEYIFEHRQLLDIG